MKRRTALHTACLISKGIAVHALSESGQTSFRLPQSADSLRRVRGASDVHGMARAGRPPDRQTWTDRPTAGRPEACPSRLHELIRNAIALNSIKAGLGVNAVNYNLESSVMLAARNNLQAAVELLLSSGAKMNMASLS